MNPFSSHQQRELRGQAWAPRWWAVLLIGLALWIASVGVAFFTSDVVLLPTIVLLGSFLVPVTAVVWYLDHDPSPALSPRRIVAGFIIAGVVGVLAASVVESWVVFGPGPIGMLKVGLIEEFVKGAAVVLVAWGLTSFGARDGIVLGATVGFGFAALESSGYALASLFVVQGGHLSLSLTSVVLTELVRGVALDGDPRRCDLSRRSSGSRAGHIGRDRYLRRRVDPPRCFRHPWRYWGLRRDLDHRARAPGLPVVARRSNRLGSAARAGAGSPDRGATMTGIGFVLLTTFLASSVETSKW